MFNNIIKFLIENKLVAFILLLFLLGSGLYYAPFEWKLGNLERNPVAVDAIPDIGENQQIVYTQWSGRSPQNIEDQITFPLTSALLGVPGVKTIRSSSMFGFSTIYVIFDEGIDFYWSRSRLLEKLNALPAGLLPQDVKPALGPDATGLGQIFWYTLEGRDPKGNVTGGWDLHELRSIQDNYVKFGLASVAGVSEVASVGGHVQEYQIELNPGALQQYQIPLQQIVSAVQKSNRDSGAQTLEINQVEYLVRGLGYFESLSDIENVVVSEANQTPIYLKDVAKVQLGPAERRGILDKGGAEVVGGVVVARYGANPMKVIRNTKEQIQVLDRGLPSKVLADGTVSQLTIVPFYDRSELITETLDTLNEALVLEVLITMLVIVFMVVNVPASLLISGLLPLSILMVFVAMKWGGVDANIVALSGIAIAIGTMVDIGVILSENMLRHLSIDKGKTPINQLIFNATKEVSGAILTAVATTIVSFVPVFLLTGAEGKLFRPLAFTKTFALISAVMVTLFIIPPLATLIFRKQNIKQKYPYIKIGILSLLGLSLLGFGSLWGIVFLLAGLIQVAKLRNYISSETAKKGTLGIILLSLVSLLAVYWRPLGFQYALWSNGLFVGVIVFGLLGAFWWFQSIYAQLLAWTLAHKKIFLILPLLICVAGVLSWRQMGKEFMPALDEGSFLLMPTSLPHAGIAENKRVLQHLDMAVAQIPEIKMVVGKSGRVDSAIDPAPLSMYENMITYEPEYIQDGHGKKIKFETDKDGKFILKNGTSVSDFQKIDTTLLVRNKNGSFFRQWREKIQNPDDIWTEIVTATRIPGVTSAPKLQPIQTRLLMLQTGMRSPMGIKILGQNLDSIEKFGLEIEPILKQVKGVNSASVYADRIVGKPYLLLDIHRKALARYGLHIDDVQEVIETAIGGKMVTQTVEGRARYAVKIRYPRNLRNSPEAINDILVPTPMGSQIPLKDLVTIRYEKGPQMIKSENTFLMGFVLFNKQEGFAEVNVVNDAQKTIDQAVTSGMVKIPKGVHYEFTGTYEQQIHAEKQLQIIMPMVLLVIFLILYFQFRSVTTSFMIFSGIAIAFSGGFILLWLYGQPWFLNFEIGNVSFRELFHIETTNLSIAVWVGFIALFGIATDDGVVMATYLKQNFDQNKPNTIAHIRSTVIDSGNKRIRPCLMTTATTILALLPIFTSTGKGSDIMIPMAIPAFGGMLVALITLFVVPVLYSSLEEYRLKAHSKKIR